MRDSAQSRLERSETVADAISTAQEENPDQAVDILAAKVVDLGRRFNSSDVAFPLREFPRPFSSGPAY